MGRSGWLNGWIDVQKGADVNGWMNRWINGWMGRWTSKQMERQAPEQGGQGAPGVIRGRS